MANDALNANAGIGGSALQQITTHGSDWYWAVTAVMAVATIAFIGLSFTKPRSHRVFHYITAAITLVASIAYYSMASNLGQVPIQTEFIRSSSKLGGIPGGTREIFYVRYIDWFVTTPLLLLDLLLTCGLPWPTILYTLLMDEVMIVTGLVGALTRSSYKWGYYAFGNAAFLFVAWNVVFVGRKHAAALGPDISRTYTICGVWTIFLWFLYPIAWGVSEGGNAITSDGEAVFYGVLDLLAKPVFGALLLWGHRNIDPAALGLHIRDYDDIPGRTGGNMGHGEKHVGGQVTNGTTDGTTNGTTPTTTV